MYNNLLSHVQYTRLLTIYRSNIYQLYFRPEYGDPLCEIQAKVSKYNYEKTSIKVRFLPLIKLAWESQLTDILFKLIIILLRLNFWLLLLLEL